MKPFVHSLCRYVWVCACLSLGIQTARADAAAAAERPPAHTGVVEIRGFQTTATEAAEPTNRSLGFIVEKEGFLLTNYKNLTDTTTGMLLETFEARIDGKTYAAEVIGVEPTLNLGILKLDTEDRFTPPVMALKRSVAPGTEVEALTLNDAGVQQEVLEGHVTALNTRQCYQESLTSTMFRAKIPVNERSVGGPVLFADTGEVAAIYTGFKPVAEPGHAEEEGETHLLPINLCFNIYDSIKQKRSLRSPWTGFSVRALSAEQQRFFPTAKKHHGGVAIEHVWKDSPAEKLGLRVDDILVQFSYNRIQSVGDFQKWLYMYGVGHPVKLVILRNGSEYLMTDYVIEERPAWARPK